MSTPSSAFSATVPAASALTEGMPPLRLYFSLRGRVSRRTFWAHGVCGLAALGIVLGALLNIAGFRGERVEGLVNLVLLWPFVAISTKRWHDRDRSGAWVLVALVPVLGTLWLLIANGFLAGTPGPNRYGEQPVHGRLP